MCKVLEVSKSGYHAWISKPITPRDEENQSLEKDIQAVFAASNNVYGGKKIKRAILKKPLKERNFKGTIINHKRIERLMKKLEIRSKVCKKYKATTNSNHTLPVSENLLDRDFLAERPNQKLVSDITYVGTDEG